MMEDRKVYIRYYLNSSMVNSLSGWEKKRLEIRERDDFQCRDCGLWEGEVGHTLHVHHIIPLCFGGAKFDNENLITVCMPCHLERHRIIRKQQFKIKMESIRNKALILYESGLSSFQIRKEINISPVELNKIISQCKLDNIMVQNGR